MCCQSVRDSVQFCVYFDFSCALNTVQPHLTFESLYWILMLLYLDLSVQDLKAKSQVFYFLLKTEAECRHTFF